MCKALLRAVCLAQGGGTTSEELTRLRKWSRRWSSLLRYGFHVKLAEPQQLCNPPHPDLLDASILRRFDTSANGAGWMVSPTLGPFQLSRRLVCCLHWASSHGRVVRCLLASLRTHAWSASVFLTRQVALFHELAALSPARSASVTWTVSPTAESRRHGRPQWFPSLDEAWKARRRLLGRRRILSVCVVANDRNIGRGWAVGAMLRL